MLIVTDPPNVSTREIINISREFTEITALSYGARAPLALVAASAMAETHEIESDQATCVANASMRKQNIDCRD